MEATSLTTIRSSLEMVTVPTLSYAFSFFGCIYFLITLDACVMHAFLEVSDAGRGLK